MVSANFKWAVLSALAKWPDRRATIEEIRREADAFIANMDRTELLQRFAALDDIDIFQSGLASRNEAGLQITGAGLALVRSVESPGDPSPEAFLTPIPPALRSIDDLIGTEERLKIFDLELRSLDAGFEDAGDDHSAEEQGQSTVIETDSEALAIDESEGADAQAPEIIGEDDHHQSSRRRDDQTTAITTAEDASQDAPTFLRRSFGSGDHESARNSSQRSKLFTLADTKTRLVLKTWRRHFLQGNSGQKPERPVGGVGGAAFALLSLLMVVTWVGVAIALGQIRTLRSQMATLQRQLLPLSERLARLEQAEMAKRNSKQQADEQNRSETRKTKLDSDIQTDPTAIDLSPEEIQLIKEYIKPAPYLGTLVPAISVGDAITGATIPLPSQLTDKVPKLLGARFTTRNGAIIIVRRNSQRADAVLPP